MPEPDVAERVWEGRTLAVGRERWGEAEREIVERADSVVIVAVDDEGRVLLVRQFREAAARELVELPAGTVDEGEEPLATARRELEEETGLRAERWRTGPVVYSTPGFCRERIHLFFAERLAAGEAQPDEGEEMALERWSRDDVERRLGEIADAKTLAGVLLFLRRS